MLLQHSNLKLPIRHTMYPHPQHIIPTDRVYLQAVVTDSTNGAELTPSRPLSARLSRLQLVASLGNTTGTSGAASLHDHSPHRGKEYNAHNHCGGHDADWHLSTMAQTRIASIWDDEITSSNANLKAA